MFSQGTSVPNFSQIRPFLKSPDCQPRFGEKLVPRPQKSKFSKSEKTPLDIHPRNKCIKFQQNPTIFEVSRLPQSFSLVLAKNSSPGPKNQNFQKMKKNTPRYSPKEQVYQISAKSDHFWSLQAAPKFLWQTDRQIHRRRHCQILPQLKLRTRALC